MLINAMLINKKHVVMDTSLILLNDSIKEEESANIYKLTANGLDSEQVETFNYLRSFLTSTGKSDCEIKRRIALSKAPFNKRRSILISSNITRPIKQRILTCYIWSFLLYGCETCSISSCMQKQPKCGS